MLDFSLVVNEGKIKLLSIDDARFIFNELRKASVIWDGRKEVLRLARKKVLVRYSKDKKAIYKYHWQCAACQKWFRSDKELEVDHIFEIGGVTGFSGDWNETINKIFPRPVEKHLQALCVQCHAKKTLAYNSARSLYKRKRPT